MLCRTWTALKGWLVDIHKSDHLALLFVVSFIEVSAMAQWQIPSSIRIEISVPCHYVILYWRFCRSVATSLHWGACRLLCWAGFAFASSTVSSHLRSLSNKSGTLWKITWNACFKKSKMVLTSAVLIWLDIFFDYYQYTCHVLPFISV